MLLILSACTTDIAEEIQTPQVEEKVEIDKAIEAEKEAAAIKQKEAEAEAIKQKEIEEKEIQEKLEKEKLEEERIKVEEEKIKAEEEVKQAELAKNFIPARVSKHIDGDTVHVTLNSGEVLKIRMIGVDTPETVHPSKPVEYYGKEASNFTKNSIYQKTVYLEKDVSETDRYGRSLRYIWLEIPEKIDKEEIKNKMFNGKLVHSGYANSATFPPDVKYQEYFLELEAEARNSGLGLWNANGADEFQTPIANKVPEKTNTLPVEANFIGNINSMKFHKESCRWASETSPRNRVPFTNREGAIGQGYVPCKVCHP